MAFPPLFAAHAAYAERVKAAMLYCCDLSPPRGERVRYAVRREAAHERSRSTAPVGLRRMRELRNCHIKGNFVTETALFIGAVETNTRLGDSRIRGLSLKLTTLSYRSTRKKDFAERFFAKRSGERFKRGVRLRRITRSVRSAVTTSVQKEIREPIYCQSQTLTHFARNSCSSGLPFTDCDAATMGRMRCTYWIAVSVLAQNKFKYFSASASLPCNLKMR